MQFSVHIVALAATVGLASATTINGASYNKPSAGPSTVWFAGATSLPATKIASAAAAATKVPSDASYILEAGGTAKATIKSDWASFSKVCWNIPICLGYSI
jgi:chitosanase